MVTSDLGWLGKVRANARTVIRQAQSVLSCSGRVRALARKLYVLDSIPEGSELSW